MLVYISTFGSAKVITLRHNTKFLLLNFIVSNAIIYQTSDYIVIPVFSKSSFILQFNSFALFKDIFSELVN
jgi:hypothetical protein